MEKERVSRFPLGCSYLLNKKAVLRGYKAFFPATQRQEKKSGLTLHKINALSLKKGS